MTRKVIALFLLGILLLQALPALAYDSIGFGHYEQDGNPENGPEEIRWLVLEKQDGKMLLLSEKALDAVQYHEKWREVTWENCTVRAWLQESFVDMAFSDEEKERLLTVTNVNPPKKNYKTRGGNDTEDTVFLLSYEEVSRYFPEQEARRVECTEYSRAQGIRAKKTGLCAWWLRTPGQRQYHACTVTTAGNGYDTFDVTCKTNGIRPAVWIADE